MSLNIHKSIVTNFNHIYFKLNEDDILHIVKGYLLTQLDLEQSSGTLNFVQYK